MLAGAGLVVLLLLAVLVVLQAASAAGGWRGTITAVTAMIALGLGSGALEWIQRHTPRPPEDQTKSRPVQSQTCFKCHETHYASWQRTFHRTMTREATPEFVKADFDDAVHQYLGVTSRLTRRGDRYFLETVDPAWMDRAERQRLPLDQFATAPRREFSVDRLVGSHWFQHLLHRDEDGRYLRLPLVYHLVEKRWIHINGAFLVPATPFFAQSNVWNQTCLYCHNTRPVKNPITLLGQTPGYKTTVGELGIACEACHGAGERHVRAHQNPARRLAQRYSGEADPTIVNPARLPVARRRHLCALSRRDDAAVTDVESDHPRRPIPCGTGARALLVHAVL